MKNYKILVYQNVDGKILMYEYQQIYKDLFSAKKVIHAINKSDYITNIVFKNKEFILKNNKNITFNIEVIND